MEDFETQLHTIGKMGREVKMTESESSLMRSNIEDFVSKNPISYTKKTNPIVSPYANIFGFAKAMAFVFVGVILGTTGIASASLQSLPGDILYPIKTSVVEPITGTVVATSLEQKVSYEEKLIYKRLAEIEELKEKEMLDTKRTLIAQKAIARQSDRLDLAIHSIEKSNAVLAIKTNEKVSNEFKRHEDMFENKDMGAATMMMSLSIEEVSPKEAYTKNIIEEEIKIRRELLDEKRRLLHEINDVQITEPAMDTGELFEKEQDAIDNSEENTREQLEGNEALRIRKNGSISNERLILD